ncbi:SDR family oxidoreductase [Mycobacterium vicinigordonae]|uniref:SDR family oxidoreductase n=1 Tax=Mycobacterium vicinigordonae TaxID=1719132 RepID=A0A7D6I8W9_9MYCO|nr:SDR family oxidoreductase [Mycobacterium vicinigordonae]
MTDSVRESGLVAGKVAVVTGAASGLGRAIALALDREGAKAVVVADLHREPREGGPATDVVLRCPSKYVECDVTNPDDVERAVSAADEFGGVDIMVNNAGIVVIKPFLEFTEDEYDRQMAVNAKGVFFGTQAAGRRMAQRGAGVIVNMSSVAALAGSADWSGYSASKAAAKLISSSAAQALAPSGVRVNSLHPGLVTTEMARSDLGVADGDVAKAFAIPFGRAACPDEIADVAVVMCSDLSRYMTGSAVVVDGGMINTL